MRTFYECSGFESIDFMFDYLNLLENFVKKIYDKNSLLILSWSIMTIEEMSQ